MKFAYADPPYLGCGALYKEKHAEALDWNDPEHHRRLIVRLREESPDGWALSLSTPSLQAIMQFCPADVRVGAWVKPFAVFKPNVNPAYAWEPVIWRGGRKGDRDRATVRDWVAESITLKRGLTGAKPRKFCRWVFGLLGAEPGDTLDDIFPGTNAVGAAWAEWVGDKSPLPHLPLEAAIGAQ
jgi:hypothetical protein